MNEKARILVVDDDESTRKSLALIGRGKRYGVETAGTGQEALKKAWNKDINVALVDLKLPDMEGVNLIAPLKKMHPELAVIMITGFASVETAIQALNKGASAYITKPLNIDELCSKVEEAIEKQRLLAENKRLVLELQRELGERKLAEEERERLLAELSKKTKELEQVIYTTSHDLRSPLVNIQGFTRELEQAVKQVHEYQVPEIIAFPIILGSKEYMDWLKESM